MMMLAMLAAATAMTPEQTRDIRCVAVLGIVAGEQQREAGWGDVDTVIEDGLRFAAIIGERTMTETKRSANEVRTLMVDAATDVRRAPLTPIAVTACIARMREVDPQP